MTKKMKIKLLPNGEIQMETVGVKGKKCLDYVEILKQIANAKIIDKKITQEYYETEENVINDNINVISKNTRF